MSIFSSNKDKKQLGDLIKEVETLNVEKSLLIDKVNKYEKEMPAWNFAIDEVCRLTTTNKVLVNQMTQVDKIAAMKALEIVAGTGGAPLAMVYGTNPAQCFADNVMPSKREDKIAYLLKQASKNK